MIICVLCGAKSKTLRHGFKGVPGRGLRCKSCGQTGIAKNLTTDEYPDRAARWLGQKGEARA